MEYICHTARAAGSLTSSTVGRDSGKLKKLKWVEARSAGLLFFISLDVRILLLLLSFFFSLKTDLVFSRDTKVFTG